MMGHGEVGSIGQGLELDKDLGQFCFDMKSHRTPPPPSEARELKT